MELPDILADQREFLESSLQPSAEITFERRATKPWESKLGGCPYLESAEDYPCDDEGRPMMFFAQLNMAEVPPLPDFPRQGLLQFYVTDNDMLGLDAPCVVRYIPDFHTDESRLLTENPFREEFREREPFYHDGAMHFELRQMPITTECGALQDAFEEDLSAEQNDALYDICYAEGSRVGGYPLFVQSAPLYYEDGDCDVLLLQLDTDEVCGMMFGDAGNCNFFISREALKNCDFSEVEYDWQCC